ncbi:hypothetical protein, partial [Arthrobacter sp. SX1312]|uniref:hypothetical protein n=1 Tax=Arthrobacter sp. SX1312 TaxID=2058896 RepID=UPI0015E23CAA
MEERNGHRGVALYPRELTITGVNDNKFWVWHSLVLGSIGKLGLEAPKLVGSTHVEIRGKLKMSVLTPGVKYQVSLLAMLSDPVEGWESCPVNLKLTLPDGTSQSRKVNLSKFPKNQLVMLVLGHFEAVDAGEFSFSMVETSDLHIKK